ncbi:MAG TPA: hypothetical protein PLL05_08040, partial [Muribaculaceae bacterium]|nr:hypothetical protein [Muribaculaceae bacterium]
IEAYIIFIQQCATAMIASCGAPPPGICGAKLHRIPVHTKFFQKNKQFFSLKDSEKKCNGKNRTFG